MWKRVLPEVPQHLLLGKGLGFDAREAAALQLESRNDAENTAGTELVGDYHNGPLSVILGFGIFGVIGFLWFIYAGLRVLYQNYKFGHPEYHRLNTFLFGYFLAKFIFFMTIFGGFYSELMIFTGLVGLSVSLNRGVARKTVPVQHPQFRPQPLRFRPPDRKPVGAHV
jgi:O-antigen ligase